MKKLELWQLLTDLLFFLENARRSSLIEGLEDAEKIIEFRSDLRKKINILQRCCEKEYGAKTSYYIIFPIVVFCDETVSMFLAQNSVEWPKMQKEIFNTQDGGEKFYELLEQVLQNPTYPEVVYQFNYLILKAGYKGKLVDDTGQQSRDEYLTKLEKLLSKYISPSSTDSKEYAYNSDSITFRGLLKTICRKHFYLPIIAGLAVIYMISLWVIAGMMR
ncbi:DotU family type IV/VI secretion system protein [Lentisphaerota bacterium ZTH]|nr:DotU family type IV/VI secretion system protein [Lentisphaerota bacterium]WET07244.1 DotU family type IV/VI secretion system protein [Lentisphaerota bacterium ZTH]